MKKKLNSIRKEEALREVKEMGIKHGPVFKEGQTYYVMTLETKPDKEEEEDEDGTE